MKPTRLALHRFHCRVRGKRAFSQGGGNMMAKEEGFPQHKTTPLMDNAEGRPAKRARTESGKKEVKTTATTQTGYAKDNNVSRPKSKTKKLGGSGILNTIEQVPPSKRKAISYNELKYKREQSIHSDNAKRFGSIIDLRDESDTSLHSESSPFKVIRSSQEFNIDVPEGKKPHERVTSPSLIRTKLSSDDTIFWITTPRSAAIKDKQNNETNNKLGDDKTDDSPNKLPSSPLKTNIDSQLKKLPDPLLDPEIKSLMDKYKHNKLDDLPSYKRSISDPKALNGSMLELERPFDNSTQIVSTKHSMQESVTASIKKKMMRKKSEKVALDQNITKKRLDIAEKIDLASALAQIGSELRTSSSGNDKENSLLPHSLNNINEIKKPLELTTEKNSTQDKKSEETNTSDTFSDDIDLSEVAMHATQAAPIQKDESDDEFSDDDDDIMDKIEMGLTQPQIRTSRPNTDQTDIEVEMETTTVANKINMIDLNQNNGTSIEKTITKYKGMMTKQDEGVKSNKPFQLFDETENLAKSALHYDTMKRLQIREIQEGTFKKGLALKKQFILTCITENDTMVKVFVRDHWISLNFKVNDVIHIILDNKGGNFRLVDDQHNLLIWHPDTLLSATRIAEARECRRKSLISHKYNGPGIVAVPFIIGNIVHTLFQQCLLYKRVDFEFVDDILESQLEDHLIEIYAAGKDRTEMKNILLEHYSYIKEWITAYVSPEDLAFDDVRRNSSEYKVTNVLDIEEDIVSPVYGLKGIIDVVIEAQLSDNRKLVIPLEIKTGRQYESNNAQVALYTLLIRQRYGINCYNTSLVYTKLHECYLHTLKNDFRYLVNIRNELVQYLVYAVTDLPPIVQRASCERCFSLAPCMVLNKMVENGTAEESGIEKEMYEEITSHLDKKIYTEFFNHWDMLITKEEGLLNFARTDVWRHTSQYREENGGNCIGNLRAVSCDFSSVVDKYVYVFERDATKYPPLTTCQLAKNDRIILSDEDSMFALAHGTIKLLRADLIVIITDRNWSNSAVRRTDFDSKNNQTFRSVLRTKQNGKNESQNSSQQYQQLNSFITSKNFRIDKDPMFHGMAMARFNLLNLFLPDGDSKSRELIVELRKPEFNAFPHFKYNPHLLKSKLNEDQMNAVDAVSKMDDYCLILGMPGTGKTTVISTLVDLMVKNGKTVLISSYTHSAVDNICEKLIKNAERRQESLPLLRVGSPSKLNEIVRPYCIYSNEFDEKIKNKSEFKEIVNDCQVVAATCLGLNDVIFGTVKKFDYCIIDEASQVTVPVVLGPIAFADKFILVGDHYQLPPLVIHPEARQEGLDQSLFKILSDNHPSSVIELTYQYRMCSEIMSLSNELIYDGRLKCGSEEVANQRLTIPYLDTVPIDGTCIKDILDPERRVVFVNEDEIKSIHEVSIGDKIENPGEAKLITSLIKVMSMAGIQQQSIGVMSFYKAQLRHFFVSLAKYKDIEILTADRFQGRDKDIIIISLVRSEVIGDLLKEWRRVNVAMTRAKCKLIIFGSKKLLENVEQFEGFMEMIKSNGWYYDLKEGDEKISDNFEFLDDQSDMNNKESRNSQRRSQADTNFRGTQRLDRESRLIRRTHVLKYVIDDLTK